MSETDAEVTTDEQDPGLALATTPNYNEPEDADRYPVAIPNPLPAHTVFKGDPRIDGPYLDDVHEAEAEARREAKGRVAEIQKQKAEEGQKIRENLQQAANLVSPSVGAESESAPEDGTPEEFPEETLDPFSPNGN